MACQGFEHGTRVKVRQKFESKALRSFQITGTIGVVAAVNHDKHRLSINFAGRLLKDVDAHQLEKNTNPLANNLPFIISLTNLHPSAIAKMSDLSLDMIKSCLSQAVTPNRAEAVRVVLAVNQLASSQFGLQDVFPLEEEGEANTGAAM